MVLLELFVIVHLFKESPKVGDRAQMLIAMVKLVKAIKYQAMLMEKIEELMEHADAHYDGEIFRDGFIVGVLH